MYKILRNLKQIKQLDQEIAESFHLAFVKVKIES